MGRTIAQVTAAGSQLTADNHVLNESPRSDRPQNPSPTDDEGRSAQTITGSVLSGDGSSGKAPLLRGIVHQVGSTLIGWSRMTSRGRADFTPARHTSGGPMVLRPVGAISRSCPTTATKGGISKPVSPGLSYTDARASFKPFADAGSRRACIPSPVSRLVA